MVFGVRPVEELCRARPREVAVVYLAEGHRSREIEVAVAAAKDRGIAVEIRPRALVAGLAGAPAHQGIVAIVGEYRYALIADMLAAAQAASEAPLLLLLDCITDPQNFGALVRSAEVLGAHGSALAAIACKGDQLCAFTMTGHEACRRGVGTIARAIVHEDEFALHPRRHRCNVRPFEQDGKRALFIVEWNDD